MIYDLLKNIILNDEDKKALTSLGSINTAKDLAKYIESSSDRLKLGEFDYSENIDKAYIKNLIAHFAVNLKADAASEPRVELWSKGRLLSKPANNHPLFGLWSLLKNPNNQMDWADLIKQYFIYMDLAGECFLRRIPNPSAIKRGNGQLELINPSRITIKNNTYIIAQSNKKDLVIPFKSNDKREILHRVDWHPLSNRGLSKLTPAWRAIQNFNAGLEWNFSLMKHAARLGIIATIKSEASKLGKGRALTQEQIEDLAVELDKFTGPDRAGKSLVMAGNIELQEFGQTNKDLEWNIMLEQMAKFICLTLRVDPIFLGFKGDSTYSNKKEAYVGLYKFVILPSLNQFKSDFEHWMKEIFPGDWEIRFNLDDIAALEPVREASWNRAINAFTAGLISIDEAREMMGFGSSNQLNNQSKSLSNIENEINK